MSKNGTTSTATRERILRYALEEFLEHGVKSVKMDDIAAGLGVSKRTIYELFGDKENMLAEAIEFYGRELDKELNLISKTTPNMMEAYVRITISLFSELQRMNPSFYVDLRRHGQAVEVVRRMRADQRRKDLEFVTKFVEEGYFRDDLDYELVLEMQDLQKEMIMEKELYRKFSFFDIMRTVNDMNFRSVCTKKGMQELEKSLRKVREEFADEFSLVERMKKQ